jgi:hypothetical protein
MGYAVGFSIGALSLVLTRSSTWPAIESAIGSAKAWFVTHLIEPFRAMVGELLFNRVPRTGLKQAADDAEQSLQRMLYAYRRDHGLPTEVDIMDMKDIHVAYEKALAHPIREAVVGDLVRLGLIQAQVVKNETLQLATEMDDIMTENHFNSQLLATLPALGMLNVAFGVLRGVWRRARDETNSKESARAQIKLALWEVQLLLIREDDGPSLYSYLTSDDRGSEGGGSEQWNQNLADGILRNNTFGSQEDDDIPLQQLFIDDSQALLVDPTTRYRRQLAGQLITTLHHLSNILIRSRTVLFRGRDNEWLAAMRDVGYLFAREGWTAHARLQLAQCLANELVLYS